MQCGTFRSTLLFAICLAVCCTTAGAAADSAATRSSTRPATRPAHLTPGDHRLELTVDGKVRSYFVHVPLGYDRGTPTPVVLAFHGAMMNGAGMAGFSGLSGKADEAGFVVVYPNGTGLGETFLFFNAGADARPGGPPDDVAFTAKLLDDLTTVVNVDPKRVFATGMSNGGMLCHRVGAELSDRIAAIAPVAGTLAIPAIKPTRPMPVIHFHGAADAIVPVTGTKVRTPATMRFMSVDDTIQAWRKANACQGDPVVTEYPDTAQDGTSATRTVYGPGKAGAEVVLVEIKGGGHTWPGIAPPVTFIGKSTKNISANDMMWDFFRRHPMP